MITPTLTRVLADLPPTWVHEHTALYSTDTTKALTRSYTDLDYTIRLRGEQIAFLEDERGGYSTRIELIPFNENFVPHEAFAFKTYADYTRAYSIIEQNESFGKYSNGGDGVNLLWTMYRYEESGQTYYVQFLWRSAPIFPNLSWPQPATAE